MVFEQVQITAVYFLPEELVLLPEPPSPDAAMQP